MKYKKIKLLSELTGDRNGHFENKYGYRVSYKKGFLHCENSFCYSGYNESLLNILL